MKQVNYILIILLLSIFTIVNSRAALGIDFGSEFIKVAVVKVGSPIDLILNENSKRKSENMIGLLGKDRFFSSNAKTKVKRKKKKIKKKKTKKKVSTLSNINVYVIKFNQWIEI